MDKGLACGSILESCDDLVVCCVGELGASLSEAAFVVAETLTLLLSAMKKLTGVAESGVGALEIPYEGIPELCLAVDPPPGRCSSQVRVESARYNGMLLMMKSRWSPRCCGKRGGSPRAKRLGWFRRRTSRRWSEHSIELVGLR
jgi:hypothetical protein